MISFIKSDAYQKLQLANNLFSALYEGDKHVTFRFGRRSLELDKLLFVSTDPVEVIGEDWDIYCERGSTVYMCQLVNVTEIRLKRFRDITDEEAQTNDFDNLDFGPSSVMTFIYFEVLGG